MAFMLPPLETCVELRDVPLPEPDMAHALGAHCVSQTTSVTPAPYKMTEKG